MSQHTSEGQAPAISRRTYYNPVLSTRHHYDENINKIIRLRCIFGRQPQKLSLVPATPEGSEELLGVERLAPELVKDRPYVVTRKTRLVITDGLEFNLNNEVDRINWNWVQYCKEIGENLDASLFEHSEVAYYVEDEEGALDQKISKRDLQFQAESLVRKMTPDQRYDYARLMGNDMSLHKHNEVLDYMLDAAQTNFVKLLAIDKDTYKTDRLLLLRFIDTGIVREENKAFYYQQIRIGLDESSALAYLLDSGKRDIVDQMKHEYQNKRRPAHGGSVPAPVRGMTPAVPQSSTGAMPQDAELQLLLGQVERLAPQAWAQHFEALGDSDRYATAKAVGAETLTALVQTEVRQRLQSHNLPASPFVRQSGGVTAPTFHHLAGESGGIPDQPAAPAAKYAAADVSLLPVEDAFGDESAEAPRYQDEAETLPVVNVIENRPSADFTEDNGEPFRTAQVDVYTTSAEPLLGAGGIPRKGGKFTARTKND